MVAVVMVLQRLEGLSDRDAVDRFAFDLRWKSLSFSRRSGARELCERGAPQ
jgi:hypothetical protein